ncbi:STIP1 y and U box-containing protein 1 [Modicella reniformis]|uniref:RING-type E3 ubiquitin transferase n=1 Tax=Modicella reniformis TaxID=1440133 RepID=A0A9P6MGX2_9FUNG|nr:STIP1 y and U box-containing protein 1 [Modicella reniformis]
MTSNLTADQHKLKGNEHFKRHDYDNAIQEYSTAIVKNPKMAVYYCNRANCFLKMGKAQLELGQPSEAYASLKRSYDFALEQRSSFTKEIVLIIGEVKKQKWIEQERSKLSELSETYHYLSDLIKQDIQHRTYALGKDSKEMAADLRSEKDRRLRQLETLLQRAETPDEYAKPYIQHKEQQQQQQQQPSWSQYFTSSKKSPQQPPNPKQGQQQQQTTASPFYIREVPDYYLDKITFEIMHDPVISTKSGISYERNTLLEHFSYGRLFDPVAQVPLTEKDIIPNRALKEACDDFLSKNGWAVDY